MDPEHQAYIQELYNRFYTESITGNPSTAEYAVEELLDIFDYAGDVGDDFTQLMVLLKGHAEFPGEMELMERRGIFATFNTGGNMLAQNFLAAHTHESALWDIMYLYNLRPDAPTVRQHLDKLVARYDKFDDETVIRLVDLIADADQFEWLLANLARLKEKVMYPETLLHEAAQECIDRGMTQQAIALLGELTEIEPFDPLYWRLLAQEHIKNDDLKLALQAVDYALAIDGKDIDTQLLKAQVTFDLEPDHGDSVERVKRLHRKHPDDSTVTFLLAQMLTLSGGRDESLELLLPMLESDPTNPQLVQAAFSIHDDELTAKVSENYIVNQPELDDNAVEQFTDHLVTVNCIKEAVLLQLQWLRHNQDTRLIERIVSGLYMYGMYAEMIQVATKLYGEFPEFNPERLGVTEWIMVMLASARADNRNMTTSLAASIAVYDLGRVNFKHRLDMTSAKAIATTLLEAMDKTAGPLDAEVINSFDPYL